MLNTAPFQIFSFRIVPDSTIAKNEIGENRNLNLTWVLRRASHIALQFEIEFASPLDIRNTDKLAIDITGDERLQFMLFNEHIVESKKLAQLT